MLFAYLYLIRVPLLCVIIVTVLPLLALSNKGAASELLAGVFDIGILGAIFIGFCSVLFAAACAVTADLTLRYAHDRFSVPPLPPWLRVGVRVSDTWLWLQRFPRLKSLFEDLSNRAFVVLVGALIAVVSLLVGICRKSAPWPALVAVTAFLLFYFLFWKFFRGFKGPGDRRGVLFRPPLWVRDMICRLAEWTPPGYTEDAQHKYADEMPSRHAGVFMAMLWSFGFYVLVFILGRMGATPPALACVLLLMTFLCWTVSGIAFLTDRFRVPILAVLIAVLAYTGTWAEADHTFDTFPSAPGLPHAADLAAFRPGPFIAIAASGGGIHAAGWTTRILAGLYQQLPKQLRTRFVSSVRVISSVSGGSVGSLYFANAFRIEAFRKGDFTSSQLDDFILRPAVKSSLDELVQKLVFDDWWRTLLPPIPIAADRGRAAEDAWVAAIADKESRVWLRKPLGDWGDLSKKGQAPALLFNSTVVDTGERAVLATVAFETPRRGRRLLQDLYDGQPVDMAFVSAARLSATFPIVSPSARAAGSWPKRYRYHFVDGGYYDNYGMSTLLEWLDDALTSAPSTPVLVIQIRDSDEASRGIGAGESGFLNQTFAPLQTMIRFRDAGQVAHGNFEQELLTAKFGDHIRRVIFSWPESTAPLSWHLTESEKRQIEQSFGRLESSKRCVCDFLAANDSGLHDQCAQAFSKKCE